LHTLVVALLALGATDPTTARLPAKPSAIQPSVQPTAAFTIDLTRAVFVATPTPIGPAAVLPAATATATATAPAAPRAAPTDAARATRSGVVVELRSDFGFQRLVSIGFSDGRRTTMHLNDGLGVALGWSFLPLAGGRAATRLSAGVKVDLLRASNGTATFLAFPVDLMEAVYAGPLRLGAGPSVLLAPRVTATGFLENEARTYRTAPGAVVDAEWIVSPRARTGVGLRASGYRFTAPGAPAQTALSLGLLIRADFDVAGR
jgi:hypothetical protein